MPTLDSRRRPRPRSIGPCAAILPVLLLALGPSCARSNGDGHPPALLRLLDDLDRARIRSALDPSAAAGEDLGERVALDRFERRRLFVGDRAFLAEATRDLSWVRLPPAAAPAAAVSMRRTGNRVRLSLRPPCVLLARLEGREGRAAEVSARWSDAPKGSFLGVWIAEPGGPLDLSDAAAVWQALRHPLRPPRLLRTERAPGGDAYVTHGELQAPTGSATLLVVLAPTTSIELEDLSVRWRRPWTGRLLPPHTRRADLRYVDLDGDHRESLVLAAPASASFPLRLPRRESVLDLAYARLDEGTEPARLTVTIEAEDDGEDAAAGRTLASLELSPMTTFEPLRLELTPWRGLPVRLVLRWTCGEGQGAVLALAHPEVVPLRAPARMRPDVLLLSLDTVRADRVAGFGGDEAVTPNLAALGRSGVRFTAAIAPSSWTLPSHASLLTGWSVAAHGVDSPEESLSGTDVPRLAAAMREAGYRTIAFTAGGFVHADFGFAVGFDRYVCHETRRIAHTVSGWSRVEDPVGAEMLRLLERKDTIPRFFFLHTYAAHEYLAEDRDLRAVHAPPLAYELRGRFKPWLAQDFLSKAKTERERSDLAEAVRALYAASVHAADRWVGDLLDALRRRGALESTRIVVVSDHGEELFEFGRVGHNKSLSEPLLRVPLLFCGPALGPAIVDDVVSLVDVAPTLLEWAASRTYPPCDGRSLAPLLHGGSLPPRPAVAALRDLRALRTDRFKLVVGTAPSGRPVRSLFDLESDRKEARNLADLRPERFSRLLHVLEEMTKRRPAAARRHELSPEREEELRQLGYLDHE